MSDEQINKEQGSALKEEQALLKEYQKLKESTVSKEKYERDLKELRDKNEIYLKAITEGGEVDAPRDDSGSVIDTISDLSKFKGTNLDYWKKTTKAIDQTLKALGNETSAKLIGPDGVEELVEVGEAMKQMVKDSNDDPDYFRTLFKARVQDSVPTVSAQIEKSGGLVNYLANQNKRRN